MAKFYANFPNILYNNRILTDLGVRIKLRDSWLNDKTLYYNYILKDYDKPEHIAKKYYNDETLHWVLLITNNIFDHNFDFPMKEIVFSKYIEDKYKDNHGIESLRILSRGNGYVDGLYDDVPIKITNEEDLIDVGSGSTIDVTVSGGIVSNIRTINYPGFGYDSNTRFTIENQYLGGSGSGFDCEISDFTSGYQYAQRTPDPIYRYQKVIKYTYSSSSEERFFVIDKNSYINLYDNYPSSKKTFLMNGEYVGYEVYRRTPEVTIFDHEFEMNENKRVIKILKKDYIEQAKRELMGLLT